MTSVFVATRVHLCSAQGVPKWGFRHGHASMQVSCITATWLAADDGDLRNAIKHIFEMPVFG